MLTEWATVTRDRDNRVRAAVAAGVTKHRVSVLTGIARTTIDRILLDPTVSAGTNIGPSGGPNER